MKMIGIDTNVLVRIYLKDDKETSKEAQDFLLNSTKEKSLFISSYVILECAWVLKTKGWTREQIHKVISGLVYSDGVVVSQKEVVLLALEKYTNGKADFGDYMILAEGEINNVYELKTFDKALQKELS